MSAPGSAQRPGAQSQIIVAGLLLVSLTLCALMCADGVRLVRLGPPWAAAPPGVAPGLLVGPTAAPTAAPATAAPLLAATLDPLLPTPTIALAPADVLPPGQMCLADKVVIEAAEPPGGATIQIGRGALAVAVSFCLNSKPAGRLQLAVVSSEADPHTLSLGGPVLIQAGEGNYTQSLDWNAAPWSPDLAGQYRLVVAITAEEGEPVLVSTFGGQYSFEP